jgi:hypothetical protein
MKLYESKFQRIYYDKQFAIMEFRWLLPASERSESELAQEEAIHIELLAKYQPLLVMSDIRNIHFADILHLENWGLSEYTKITEYASEGKEVRMVVLTQAEISKQLSKEESDITSAVAPQIRYFSDEVSAELWLLGEERF